MKPVVFSALGAFAVLSIAAYAFWPSSVPDATDPDPGDPMVTVIVPESFSELATLGRAAFNGVCADCHGESAAGSFGEGPPLVHRIYEPSHHGDASFLLAAQQGVPSHHWRFGNMPAQPDVTRGDVVAIVAYVRELQRSNGIE